MEEYSDAGTERKIARKNVTTILEQKNVLDCMIYDQNRTNKNETELITAALA